MINPHHIHVAMTKMCGLVATPDCQSNIYLQMNEKLKQTSTCFLTVTSLQLLMRHILIFTNKEVFIYQRSYVLCGRSSSVITLNSFKDVALTVQSCRKRTVSFIQSLKRSLFNDQHHFHHYWYPKVFVLRIITCSVSLTGATSIYFVVTV